MTKSRDDFSKATVDVLAKRAAFICSNPSCRAQTVAASAEDDNKFVYTGVAAHITAASEGGPRYNSKLTSEERSSIENGIFLCSNCATMIDKNSGRDFPADKLHEWKKSHETWVRENLNKKTQTQQTEFQRISVTSVNQTGGITAGVVNVREQPRSLTERLASKVISILPDKDRSIKVTCVLGDSEGFNFANQIKEFLEGEGYQVHGVNQAVFTEMVKGQSIDPEKYTITIGYKE